MNAKEAREANHAAARRLRPAINQKYPQGRFVGIHGGQIIADAASLEELNATLVEKGHKTKEVLVIQAGVEQPEEVFILLRGVIQ